jgi:hypothetical protein
MSKTVIILVVAVGLIGCGSGAQQAVDVPNTNRIPRKEYKDMTVEEKIEFINKTPMPDEAKQKEIARIKAGGQ